MVAKDMRPPMSLEFKKMIRQINLGMSVEEALRSLSERIESQDMDLVVTAILIQRQIGGNLAEILDKISDTINGRIKLKRDISTKTAQGRLSGLVLILFVPGLALMIYMMNPKFFNILVTNPIGWALIIITVLLQFIGIYSISKIIKIEV
jgi:tight adherence protein B